MNLKSLFLLPLMVAAGLLSGQSPLITKSSETTFFSHAPLEDIEAINGKTTAALDIAKGEIVVKMLIQHFEFENALMQEHFNENYMESEKFPAAIFKGSFASAEAIDINEDGKYTLEVSGELTIHGVTKPLSTAATIEVAGDKLTARTEFIAKPADYDIKIPSVVVSNIAEEIKVTSVLEFDLTKK